MFDGVHRGHRHVLSSLAREADRTGRVSIVVTFRNHPASVLRPDSNPPLLTNVEERLRLIRETGVGLVVPVSFDLTLSRLSAREFVALLTEQMGMKVLVVGPDSAMGREREGDISTLTALGEEMGFSVTVVEHLVDREGQPIRSGNVRKTLASGDVRRVSSLLGRHFALTGTIVVGHRRGGPLGFPTANIKPADGMAFPGDGIYATWAHVGEERYMAATSIGVRPTFQEGGHSIEAHIIDFEGDLYGVEITLEFVQRLREELKFDSVVDLQKQITKDVDLTRALLAAGPSGRA
jgi:riboflavin kinase/FMN adenylyltransferase